MSPTAVPPRPPPRGLAGFLRGVGYVFRGASFVLNERRAWRAALLPAAVNAIVLLGFLAAALFLLDELHALFLPSRLESPPAADLPWWKDALRGSASALAWVLAVLAAAFGSALGTLLVAAVLAGPFNEVLSETVERLVRADPAGDGGPLDLRRLSADAARAVWTAAQRGLIFLAIYVPLVLLSLIPVAGLAFAGAALAYSAFFMALNYADPCLDRRRLPLRRKLALARASLAPWLGFGALVTALMFVPLLPLVLAPALVAGGTLLVLDLEAAA